MFGAHWLAFGGLLLTVGCIVQGGEEAEREPPVVPTSGTPAGGAYGGQGSAAGSDRGGATTSGEHSGRTEGGVGGAPAKDDRAALPLIPLVTGHVSRLAFSPIDTTKPMLETCDDPSIEVGERATIDGRSGWLYRTYCSRDSFLLEGDGDELSAHLIKDGKLEPPAFAYIHSPVETGTTWDSGRGDQYTWYEETEPLVTPAGSFDHCWARQGGDTRISYCRGIGLVRALSAQANHRLELVEKSF
jgi:hypothetical protein